MVTVKTPNWFKCENLELLELSHEWDFCITHSEGQISQKVEWKECKRQRKDGERQGPAQDPCKAGPVYIPHGREKGPSAPHSQDLYPRSW